jgi:quinol monooxygenase YgiN
MILEIAEIHIRPGDQAAFEQAIEGALRTITAKAKGVTGYRLHRSIESPERYVMQISWNSVDDHMVTYLQSPERDVWRSIVSPFFARPPQYQHFTQVTAS